MGLWNFPNMGRYRANSVKLDKKYIFGWDSPKESFLPSWTFPAFWTPWELAWVQFSGLFGNFQNSLAPLGLKIGIGTWYEKVFVPTRPIRTCAYCRGFRQLWDFGHFGSAFDPRKYTFGAGRVIYWTIWMVFGMNLYTFRALPMVP
jgi:hypothetical protein